MDSKRTTESRRFANRIGYKLATIEAEAAWNKALVTDLKSVGRKAVPVRVRLWALKGNVCDMKYEV